MSRSFNQPPVILEIFYDITLEKGLGYLITVWRLQKPHLTSQPLSGWILMGQYFFLKCLDGIEWAKCDLLSCWTAHQMNIWLEHNLVFLCHFFWSSTIGVSRLPASTLESGIHEARRKQNKVITVLFLESQVPQLASYFLSVFQSCLMFVLHIMLMAQNCTLEDREKYPTPLFKPLGHKQYTSKQPWVKEKILKIKYNKYE